MVCVCICGGVGGYGCGEEGWYMKEIEHQTSHWAKRVSKNSTWLPGNKKHCPRITQICLSNESCMNMCGVCCVCVLCVCVCMWVGVCGHVGVCGDECG